MALTIQERLKDLRVERGLTLEQLAEQTHLSKSALGSYEADEYKDISHYALIKLAKFYGVTADYLLGLTETKNHPNADLADLRLSDELIDLLKNGRIDTALFCELATHKDFVKLLADIEIYVNGIATGQIQNLNAWVDVARAEIMEKYQPGEHDKTAYLLNAIHVQEGEYFSRRVHDDIDGIMEDIKEAHKGRAESAPEESVAAELKKDLDEVANFKGSRLEQWLLIYCKQKMKILEVTDRTPDLINRLLEVWEGSVRATHLFLSDDEIKSIKEYVPQALNGIAHLMIAEDDTDCPVAFMGIEDGTLEMLFISPEERGKGLGKRLIQYGIENYAVERLAVNEQNPLARGFYEHMGFHVYKRTDLDEQGNPYPHAPPLTVPPAFADG